MPFGDIVRSIKRDIGDVEEDNNCGAGLTVTAIAVELDTASEHAWSQQHSRHAPLHKCSPTINNSWQPHMLNSADESMRDGHECLRTGDIGILETLESVYEAAFQRTLVDLDRFNQAPSGRA